ncbi:hypothetical protein [Pedobacter agri]|uniref:hypothetical protein n=1 Tax=Pedobacter agri TaxID=454586 RepID=UPI003977B4B3
MKSNHSFSVNFFIRRNREAFGRTPIYIKITVDGSRVSMSVKQTVELTQCRF